MKEIQKIGASFWMAVAIYWTSSIGLSRAAYAQSASTLGDMLNNITFEILSLPMLISYAAYLMAVILVISAIYKLKAYSDAPQSNSLKDPLIRFGVAGALVTLPAIGSALQNLVGTGTNTATNLASVGAAGGVATTLDQVLANVMVNIKDPMLALLGIFCYIVGAIFVYIGLMRLMRDPRETGRGPLSGGTMMTFLVAAILFTIGGSMDAITESMFADVGMTPNLSVSFSGPVDAVIQDRVDSALNAAIVFVQLLGWIAFIRGWFVLRTVAEGGQATLSAGVTHIIGGALLANIAAFIKVIQDTLGIAPVVT